MPWINQETLHKSCGRTNSACAYVSKSTNYQESQGKSYSQLASSLFELILESLRRIRDIAEKLEANSTMTARPSYLLAYFAQYSSARMGSSGLFDFAYIRLCVDATKIVSIPTPSIYSKLFSIANQNYMRCIGPMGCAYFPIIF